MGQMGYYATQLANTAAKIMAIGLVASVGRLITKKVFHSANPGGMDELIERYGTWAVRTAEAICPVGDLKCIAREAERLIRVRKFRM